MSTFSDLKNKFIYFWQSKGAKEIPGLSLVPQGDSTLLFVNSGMFPLVPYLLGEKHPLGTRLCNVQRCLRTEDLEDIGDTRHLTLFHMIGNWSLGDFFKKEQIPFVLELYVEHFGLDPKRIYVSVFEGDESARRDEESIELWKQAFAKYGVVAEYNPDPYSISETLEGNANFRIFSYPKKKNWWTRGEVAGEPGGPDSETFYDMGTQAEEYEEKLHINGDNGRFVEIGNNVFMQYKYEVPIAKGDTATPSGFWLEMHKKNVDFGGGLDRIVMCAENKFDIFETTLYCEVIDYLVTKTGIPYKTTSFVKVAQGDGRGFKRSYRIIADHIKASVFLLADGVFPSNKDQGYILRRLIRRMIVQGYNLGIKDKFVKEIAEIMIGLNSDQDQIISNKTNIILELEKEEDKFRVTLESGIKEFEKLILPFRKGNHKVVEGLNPNIALLQTNTNEIGFSGKDLFYLYESFGFPIEQSLELLKQNNVDFDESKLKSEFDNAKLEHSNLSRTNSEQKFKGGLADNSEIVTALHTTHHLLLAALQKVLCSKDIHQKGSNITSERLRIDFNFDRKLTTEELAKIESQVQEWIDQGLQVERLEMKKEEAEKLGAEHEFGAKYPDMVSVYKIFYPSWKEGVTQSPTEGLTSSLSDSLLQGGIISLEFCGGPHVANSKDIAKFGSFKVLKEEASSSGIRRIKAGLVRQ
ncbi:alanine--tRNA ligase [bacterium]|nr:MAG: alanine--tRNA ligase [bacterium]